MLVVLVLINHEKLDFCHPSSFIFTAKAAAFRASVYREYKSDDDLF